MKVNKILYLLFVECVKVFGTAEEMARVVARARLEAELDNALVHLNDTQRTLRHARRPNSKTQGTDNRHFIVGLVNPSVPDAPN